MELNKITTRTLSMCGSARTFGQAIIDIAKENKNVVVLTADQSTAGRLDMFQKVFPERFFNVGIAEQNMIGIAAGLAKEGFTPFTLAQATFSTNRCFDQFKINLGYMEFGIKVVGFGAGLGIGQYGPTHFSMEDIAMVRAIPNVVILSPADCTETYKCIIAASKDSRPTYIRLTGGMGNPIVYKTDYEYVIGKSIQLKEGNDISIIGTGTMVHVGLEVAAHLEEKGYSVKVIDMHTIKPLDEEAVQDCCNSKLIVTLEEHSIIGGLGSAVAEVLSMCPNRSKHLIVGIQDTYPIPGEYNYLLALAKLTPKDIENKIEKVLLSN